jgi:hypothetical protein
VTEAAAAAPDNVKVAKARHDRRSGGCAVRGNVAGEESQCTVVRSSVL